MTRKRGLPVQNIWVKLDYESVTDAMVEFLVEEARLEIERRGKVSGNEEKSDCLPSQVDEQTGAESRKPAPDN